MKTTILATCLCILPMTLSAETVDVQLTATGQSNDFFDPLSGDLQVYRTEARYDQFTQSPNNPLQMASMHCFGSFKVLRGSAAGAGHCTLTDVDGDRILQEWALDSIGLGQGFGTWHFVAGTGKHAGVSGRGYWSSENIARTGTTVNTIIGTVTWPD